jgi:hypothetical protein
MFMFCFCIRVSHVIRLESSRPILRLRLRHLHLKTVVEVVKEIPRATLVFEILDARVIGIGAPTPK